MTVYKSNTPTSDGRVYFFRIKYKNILGVTKDYTSQKYKTKKEAENAEIDYKLEIRNDEHSSTNITIDEAFTELINSKKKRLKPQSLVKEKNVYKHISILGKYKINDLNINHYKKFEEELDKSNLSANYKNKVLALFKQIINYSNKYYGSSNAINRFVDRFQDHNQKEEMQFFTYDEYKQFDSVIDEFEWHVFFEVLYFMGLRCGEAQAITWNDINFNTGEIKINKSLTDKLKGIEWSISTPKTKSSIRTLPLPKNVLNDLKTLNNNAIRYKDYSSKWFVFGNSIPFKGNNIQNHKNKYCKESNVKQIRVHDFRHSCASLLINNGSSILLVSKYLGHSNTAITLNTYSHMYKSELENITKILDNL